MFRSLVGRLTASAIKNTTGAAKDVSGTVKDATGIRKDIVETKLAERKLEREESPIQLASLDDVKEFDPKYSAIRERILEHSADHMRSMGAPGPFGLAALCVFLAVVLAFSLLGWLIFKIHFLKSLAYSFFGLLGIWALIGIIGLILAILVWLVDRIKG